MCGRCRAGQRTGFRVNPLFQGWLHLLRGVSTGTGVAIVEMGVEDKMTPEDQHGGYFHPTLHSTSSDPTRPSATLLDDSI